MTDTIAAQLPEIYQDAYENYDTALSTMERVNELADNAPPEHREVWNYVRAANFASLLEAADDELVEELFTTVQELWFAQLSKGKLTALSESVRALDDLGVNAEWSAAERSHIDDLSVLISIDTHDLKEKAKSYSEVLAPLIGKKAVRFTERAANPEIHVSSDKVYYLADGLPTYLANADIPDRGSDGWVPVVRLSEYADRIARLSPREDTSLIAEKIARLSSATNQTYLSQAIELLLAEDEPVVEFKVGNSIHSRRGPVKLVRSKIRDYTEQDGEYGEPDALDDDTSRFSREALESGSPFSQLASVYFEIIINNPDADVTLSNFQSVATPVERILDNTLALANQMQKKGLQAKETSDIGLRVYELEMEDLEQLSAITQQVWGMFVREVFEGKDERAQRFMDECHTGPLTTKEVSVWNQLSAFIHLRKTIDRRLSDIEYQQRLSAAAKTSKSDFDQNPILYHRSWLSRVSASSRVTPKAPSYGDN